MIADLKLFAPEIALVTCLVVLFLFDALFSNRRQGVIPYLILIVTCVIGGWLTYQLRASNTQAFSGFVAIDGLTTFFRYFFFFCCAAGAVFAYGSKEVESESRSEFLILLVSVTFGMSLMAVSTNLILLYIGIETVSIVSFVLAGFRRESLESNEASVKYLIFGALASGMMLYGFSLVYGYTGSLQYVEIAKFLHGHNIEPPGLFIVALVFSYAGFAYKIASFPMHFWTPDVYEGSPTPVAAFFSVGPKAAGFAALIRMVYQVLTVHGDGGQWKSVIGDNFAMVIAIISAITMLVGNLSALAQTNVKRLLAYSSIAHVGYLLMGFVTLNEIGLSSVLFYLVVYCAMNLGAFWIVSIVRDIKGGESLSDFSGIGWQMPVLGTCMAIFLFSLTGIPIFAGFVGKFLLFGSLMKSTSFLWLAIWGVLNSVISLYYYAKIIKAMWLEMPEGTPVKQSVGLCHTLAIVGLALPTVLLGLFFSPVLQFVQTSLIR